MSSWVTETPEKVNYTKLCRLLYDGGTKAARSVLDTKIPPPTLATELNKFNSILLKLKKPKGRVLNPSQWDKLYPSSGAIPKSEDFDITLLFVLLRNICGLTKPLTGWDTLPPPADKTLEANLIRIKSYRNEVIAHSSGAEIGDVQFEDYWKKISSALVSLGLKQNDIDDLKSSPIGTEDYNKLVYEWHLYDKEIKAQLEEINVVAKKIKLDTTELKSTVDLGFADLRSRLPSSSSFSNINNLFHHDFSNLIPSLSNSYHPDTRQWIFDQVKSHVERRTSSPIMVIRAGPGMGKSVVAAKIYETYKEQGILGGCHFFQHDNFLINNPRLMFQSIARQLCDSVPGYQEALEKKLQPHFQGGNLSDLTCEELFTELFQPCCNVTSMNNVLIVIDALDECCNALKREFYKVLTKSFSCLPSWLRFVISTRPPPSISALETFGSVIDIDPEDERNKRDLQCFFSDKLKELRPVSTRESSNEILELVLLTKGLFLVAYFVNDFLKTKNITSLQEAVEHFSKAKGITTVYEDYFYRLRKELVPHLNGEEGFFKMLDAVVAAKFPIEIKIFYKILSLSEESRIPNRERKEAIHLLHQLFPVENDHVSVFHKTVIDWLTTGDHDFKVKGDGSGILGNVCYKVLDDIRQGSKKLNKPLTLTDSETYALEYGLGYMSEEKRLETQTNCFVLCSKALDASREMYEIGDSYSQQDLSSPHNFENSLSEELRDVYHQVRKTFFAYHDKHHSNCRFHDLPNFGQYLDFVLQAVHLLKNDQITSNLALHERLVPYLERKTLHREERVVDLASTEFLVANDRFLLVKNFDQQTLVQQYQFDGTLVKEERFERKKKILMSPGYEFAVVMPVRTRGNIDIFDATTLRKRTSFKPPNLIRSCHVFGNSQSWFIVTRCFNNKIYIMKGETGEEVGHPIVVQQDDEILAVSSAGHILLGRTHVSLHIGKNVDQMFTDDDENVCVHMVWTGKLSPNDPNYIQIIIQSLPILYNRSRELFLCDYNKLDQKIPIYARLPASVCRCEKFQHLSLELVKSLESFGQPVCFSDEGNLLAFYYGGFITIVHTSDGSLYKGIDTRPYPVTRIMNILFLSQERIFLQDDRTVFLFKIGIGGEIVLEHMLFLQPDTNLVQLSSTISQENMKTISYAKRLKDRFCSPLLPPGSKPDRAKYLYFEKYEFHNLH